MKTISLFLSILMVASPLAVIAQSSVMGSFPVTSRSQEAIDKYNEGAEKYLNLQYIDSEALLNEAGYCPRP